MRVASLALIAATLYGQQQPKEAQVTAGSSQLRYFYTPAATGGPLLMVLPGDVDESGVGKLFAQWQPLAASRGWSCVMPFIAGVSDQTVKATELILADAKKRLPGTDETRVYLAGQGPSTPEVFYALSREPHLWAAALAVQGTPGPAINTYRLFGANTQQAPLLWIAPPWELDRYQAKLSAAEFNVESRREARAEELFDWLASRRLPPFPAVIDCETGNPSFSRCYWIEMTKFDPKERNSVLKSTRVLAGSGAWLDVGSFGFDAQAEGPGALVSYLPPDYKGPLKLNDRIVLVAGKEIRDGRDFALQLDQMNEAKSVALLIQRGKDRVRVETKLLLPRREEVVTARLQGRYLADQKEIMLISRLVTQIRIRIPADWTPVKVTWNGLDLLNAESAGCWALSIEKDMPSATPCQ